METSNFPTSHSQENGGISHQIIRIPEEADQEWITSVEKKIQEIPKLLSKSAGGSSCCIFRVPQSLVEVNTKAYQPHIVSMGPYHHGRDNLNMIQEHKWRFLGAVLARTQKHGVGLSDLFKAIASMEKKIRDCYSETIEFSSHDLIEMMVLDGCFVIELFCIVGRLVQINLDDPLFNMSWILYFLMRDFLRLENQIPFFVLQTLFGLSFSDSRKENIPSLTELTLGFFDYVVQRPSEVIDSCKNLNGKHLLDFFRLTFVSKLQDHQVPRKISPFLHLIQSANKLHLAGIKFKPRETETFLDIKFSRGILEIPPLTIDDFTSSFLLNCVAYEQCCSHCSKHITTYVTFMSCLINSPVDAGYLSDHRIIENYFGTDMEVAKFFNNIGKDIAFDIQRSYLAQLFEDVNEYYRNNWHVRWAGFKYTYFNTPWSFMSALAALVLLILTIIQAFFAVYGYVHPLGNGH